MTETATPHCETCRCGIVEQPSAWQKYSVTTTAEKYCACGAFTILPGKYRWWFRRRAAKTPGRGASRTTESLCNACAAREGLA